MIDEETLRNYQKNYEEGGITALLKNDYKGSMCRLNELKTETLKNELHRMLRKGQHQFNGQQSLFEQFYGLAA